MMTYEEYLKYAPVITQKIDDALVSAVNEMGILEAKKLDWLSSSADMNIAADEVSAA